MPSARVRRAILPLTMTLVLAGCAPYETDLVIVDAPSPYSTTLPWVIVLVLVLAFVVNVVGTVLLATRMRRTPADSAVRRSVVLLAIGDVGLLLALAFIVANLI